MDIKARIQQYLDYQGIKTATFEKEVGLSNGYWRKTKSVSANAVADILRIYSDLSAEWVFRGEGFMIKGTAEALDAAGIESVNAITDLDTIKDIISETVKSVVAQALKEKGIA